MEPKLEHLAEFIANRRHFLNLTQEDVRLAGGPSGATITAIESATLRGSGISSSTLRKLDRALQLEAGTTHRVLDGEEIPYDLTMVATDGDDRLLALTKDDLLTVLRTVDTTMLANEMQRRLLERDELSARMEGLDKAFGRISS